jgi:hypothetical protein
MNDRQQGDSGMIPAARLKAGLEALGRIEPPDGLKEKLMAAAPFAAARQPNETGRSGRFGVLRYVGLAAAIVVVTSFAAFQCFAPSIETPRFVADINERSNTANVVDQNTSPPYDTNICDNNAVP